jgi:hypothetical protein
MTTDAKGHSLRPCGHQMVPGTACPYCDCDRLRARVAELEAWKDEAVRSCAKRGCSTRDRRLRDAEARIAELEADLRLSESRECTCEPDNDIQVARARIAELEAEVAYLRACCDVPACITVEEETAALDECDRLYDKWQRLLPRKGEDR